MTHALFIYLTSRKKRHCIAYLHIKKISLASVIENKIFFFFSWHLLALFLRRLVFSDDFDCKIHVNVKEIYNYNNNF